MFFREYKHLSHKDRALLDGRLITYHFYVASVMLFVLSYFGAKEGYGLAVVVALLAGMSLLLGLVLHIAHRTIIKGPKRDEYLATICAIVGKSGFPVLPTLFWIMMVFSVFMIALYVLAP